MNLLHVALYTKDGEIEAEGYCRVPVIFDAVSEDGRLTSSKEIRFPMAREDWGEIIGIKIWGGDTLVSASLLPATEMLNTMSAMFLPGSYKIHLTVEDEDW